MRNKPLLPVIKYIVEKAEQGNVSISMLKFDLTATEIKRVCRAVTLRGYVCTYAGFLGYVKFEKKQSVIEIV